MRAFQVICAVLLCLCAPGCETEHFRAETQLLPDGSLERSIFQPAIRTPKKAQRAALWKEILPVRKMQTPEQERLALNELRQQLLPDFSSREKSETPYLFAQGQFADAAAIPNYVTFEAPQGMSDGHLERKLERRNRALVTEWVWEERLTDVVTLADQRIARNEVAELAVTILIAACGDAWGPEYDLKNFEQWLRQDLVACFQELCDANLQLGLKKNKTPADDENLFVQGAKAVQRYGLNLFDEQQNILHKGPEIEQRVQAFIFETLKRLVRDKQDQPLTDERLQDVVNFLFQKGQANAAEAKIETQLGAALTRAINAKFGTREKFNEHFNLLCTRMFGLYGWPVLHQGRLFDYRLEVPGFVVETNGILIGNRTLRWKFQAIEAFPLGYTMRAVVAVPNLAACAKHFPRAKFDSREVVMEYLDFLQNDPTLQAALRDLVEKEDSTAWKIWQIEHLSAMRLSEILQPKP
ncbi:MAG: hypothetical protein V4719_27505 [Planctomycetota bacterium]